MMPTFGLGSYLLLVDHTSRLVREGKASTSRGVAEIFTRLGTNADTWRQHFEKLLGHRLLGRCFATRRARLREAATQLGLHHLPNLAACPAR